MTNAFKHISLCTALLCTTACSVTAGGHNPGLPTIPQEGPYEYQLGFKEGCETGATVYGNDYMRAIYKTQVRPEMMRNPIYKNAWELGNSYCRFYVSSWLMQGFVDTDFGRGVFDSRVLPDGENMRDGLWGYAEDWDIFSGMEAPVGWGWDE